MQIEMNVSKTGLIIGNSPELMEVLRAADLVAVTDVAIMISGETGTGKDLLAKHIHRNSRRHDKPLSPSIVLLCQKASPNHCYLVICRVPLPALPALAKDLLPKQMAEHCC